MINYSNTNNAVSTMIGLLACVLEKPAVSATFVRMSQILNLGKAFRVI